jgi:hypothetical protein
MPGWKGYIGEHPLPLTADTDIVKVFTALFADSGAGTSAGKASSSKRKKGSKSDAAATSAKKKSVSKTPKASKQAEE